MLNQGRTFGSISGITTKQQGGFTSAGEINVTLGSKNKRVNNKQLNTSLTNTSLAEQMYLELLKKYKR